jgi:hypothetical protein
MQIDLRNFLVEENISSEQSLLERNSLLLGGLRGR